MMSLSYWILVGQTPIEVEREEWGRWFEGPERIIAQKTIGDVHVSTVFLGIDHSFQLGTPDIPVLFESMVFRGKLDETCWRYRSYIEAKRGHEKLVRAVRRGYGSVVQPSSR